MALSRTILGTSPGPYLPVRSNFNWTIFSLTRVLLSGVVWRRPCKAPKHTGDMLKLVRWLLKVQKTSSQSSFL